MLQIQPPSPEPLVNLESLDPAILNSRLREYQALQAERPLTPDECREGIQITRILRRTNTGPASTKSKRHRSKKGAAVSLADLEAAIMSDPPNKG